MQTATKALCLEQLSFLSLELKVYLEFWQGAGISEISEKDFFGLTINTPFRQNEKDATNSQNPVRDPVRRYFFDPREPPPAAPYPNNNNTYNALMPKEGLCTLSKW